MDVEMSKQRGKLVLSSVEKEQLQALRWPRGLIDDLAQDLRAKVAFAARARLILQRPKPASEISPSPLRDLIKVHADLLSDGTDPHSLCGQLDDSRSLCQPLRSALGAYQLLQGDRAAGLE